jgi:putative ABC transport system ATP-binding protein
MEPERLLNEVFREGSGAPEYSSRMINLTQVTKNFETPAGEFPALCGITLEIAAGELVAVIGKSGSGKSTLLNLIAGIDRPSSGRVVVGDKSLGELSEARLALWRGTNIGLVFQFFQLMPTLTAAENVMLPMDFVGTIPPRLRRVRALELLEEVGLARHANKLPSALSGGEQQRVAIARALANDPPILLADEPTGNLDSRTATAIFTAFASWAQRGKTVLIVTHERDIAMTFSRTIELVDGAVADNILQEEHR